MFITYQKTSAREMQNLIDIEDGCVEGPREW